MASLVVFGPYPPPYGGVSIFVYQLSEHLKRQHIPFTLKKFQGITDAPADAVQPTTKSILQHFGAMNARTVFLDNASFFLEYPATQSSRRARWSFHWTWLGLKALRRFRWLKVVHDGTLIERYQAFAPHQQRAFHRYAAAVDEFIAVSPPLGAWLQQEIRVTQPVHSIQSLLPLIAYEDATLPAAAVSAFANCDYAVCSVGTFIPSYGFLHVANAVEALRQATGKRIALILLDAGFAGTQQYREQVLAQRSWITVLSRLPHPQALEVIRHCHAFVRGVEAESYGLSKVEAIFCGVPVVATSVGETRGMLLYDYGDEAALERQLRGALLEPRSDQLQSWAERYRAEADANLHKLLQIISTHAG
ncbi:MAG: glycosyltransferase [Anaerolineae bacterium]